MDFDLKTLRCFCALADELSFSRAAARVNLSQPAFSSQIRTLERRVGFSLFDRTTRQVALSREGEQLLPPVRRLLATGMAVDAVVEALRGSAPRRIIFGAAFYTLDIPERIRLLETFLRDHPDTPLDVVPAWQSDILQELEAGRMDIALMIGVAIPRAQHARELVINPRVESVFPDDLRRLVLRRERIMLLVPAESPLAANRSVTRERLAGLRVAMLAPIHGHALVDPIVQMLEEAGADPVVPPEPHAIGVERYARQFRIPAISLGWFPPAGGETDMAARPITGFDHSTELSLVRSPQGLMEPSSVFWAHGASLFS